MMNNANQCLANNGWWWAQTNQVMIWWRTGEFCFITMSNDKQWLKNGTIVATMVNKCCKWWWMLYTGDLWFMLALVDLGWLAKKGSSCARMFCNNTGEVLIVTFLYKIPSKMGIWHQGRKSFALGVRVLTPCCTWQHEDANRAIGQFVSIRWFWDQSTLACLDHIFRWRYLGTIPILCSWVNVSGWTARFEVTCGGVGLVNTADSTISSPEVVNIHPHELPQRLAMLCGRTDLLVFLQLMLWVGGITQSIYVYILYLVQRTSNSKEIGDVKTKTNKNNAVDHASNNGSW